MPVDTKPLRVLVLVDRARSGSGPHRNVVGSLNALSARQDVDLRLLAGEIDANEPFAIAPGLDVRLGFDPHRLSSLPGNIVRLRRAAHGCEIVYVPTGMKAFVYAWLCKRRARLVAGPNVTGIPLLTKMYNPGPIMTTRMSDGWIEMSEVRVRECLNAGTKPERISFVPHAIDSERFHPRYRDRSIWTTYGLDPERLKLLYVGHFDAELKGVRQLIEAYRLLRVRGVEADLVMVGGGDADLPAGCQGVAGLTTVGRLSGTDLVTLLASADLFLGASRYETFWFAPLEAMACGTAVVASDVGAVSTMIPHNGVEGCRVQIADSQTGKFLPDAAERLAAAVEPLLLDRERREAMAAAGRRHVAEAFTETALGENLVQAFRTTLDRVRR